MGWKDNCTFATPPLCFSAHSAALWRRRFCFETCVSVSVYLRLRRDPKMTWRKWQLRRSARPLYQGEAISERACTDGRSVTINGKLNEKSAPLIFARAANDRLTERAGLLGTESVCPKSPRSWDRFLLPRRTWNGFRGSLGPFMVRYDLFVFGLLSFLGRDKRNEGYD